MVYLTVEKPFQYLEELSIESCQVSKLKTKFAELLRMNDQLKSLVIKSHDDQGISVDMLCDLIANNQLLTELTVTTFFYYRTYKHPFQADLANVLRLTDEHPLLIELQLFSYIMTCDDVIALVPQLNPKLKQFSFAVWQSEYTDLVSRLDITDWTAQNLGSTFHGNLFRCFNRVSLKR